MDIFSLGCVIYELVTDGKLLFRLGDLLDYRQGKLDIGPALAKISNEGIREMVAHMVAVDPAARLSALEYLQRHRGTVFPDVFYTFLHQYMKAFVVARPVLTPDDKIAKLYADVSTHTYLEYFRSDRFVLVFASLSFVSPVGQHVV